MYISVGKNKTSFDGQIKAISNKSTTTTTPYTTSVYQTNPLGGLRICSTSHNYKFTTTILNNKGSQRNKKNTEQIRKTVLYWVPTHVGIWGNETADNLVKKEQCHSTRAHHLVLSQSQRLSRSV